LERDYPGITIEEGLLEYVLTFRKITAKGIRKYLEELRIRLPLTGYKSCKSSRWEIQAIFIALLCIKRLGEEDEDLEDHVISHLGTLAIAFSETEHFWKTSFTDQLDGWELPRFEEGTEERFLKDFDYGTMKPLNPLGENRQCGLCKRFSARIGRLNVFKSTCRCCWMFIPNDQSIGVEGPKSRLKALGSKLKSIYCCRWIFKAADRPGDIEAPRLESGA
jgi:hypothetical protein